MRGKYPQVLLYSSGAEIKDLARPDVSAAVDEKQGGPTQHLRLTMKPTRPSPPGAIRILDRLKGPTAEKIDGRSAHRRVITPAPGRGLVSIVGAERSVLRERRRIFRSGFFRSKLGSSR